MSQKIRCTVKEIIHHGERVYSVLLKTVSPAPRFTAGQFLHLALDEYHHGDFWPESRAFSIASSPANRDLLRITFAVKGQFTARMETELRTGTEVWVKLPYGEFIVGTGIDICLLAGGTGITAFMAFLTGLGENLSHSIYLFYGARRPELLIYRPSIEEVAVRIPSLHPVFLIEEGADPGCFIGRIDITQVINTIPNPHTVTYYLSGPPAMLKTLSGELAGHNISDSWILIDAWE
jgi:ferredoxin-NADP reductase